MARLIYDFLGLNVTSVQLRSVLGQAGLQPARAAAWKTDVPEPLARAADSGCGHFYDASMYSPVERSSDLKLDAPLHGDLPERGSDVI